MTHSVGESANPIPPLTEIRSWWEVPCIAHFCSIFSETLELPIFEIEDFESALLTSISDGEVHPLIIQIHIAFLKGILEKKDIGPDNWELLLKLHFVWRCEFLNEKYNPMEELAYSQLHTRTRVDILYRLCHWRLELDDVTECLKTVEPHQMRLEEIGTDRRGQKYWYFYGMRLYRESKEAQQYAKRSKISSSLRSRPSETHKNSQRETGTPSSNLGNRGAHSAARTPKSVKNRVNKSLELAADNSDMDSCASGEDTCKQEGSRRVTRSAKQKAVAEDTQGSQDASRQTDSSSPVTERERGQPSSVLGDNEFSSRTGWSVVCVSLKDWDELVSSLEESLHTCEVELCTCMKEELLPSLTHIDAERSRTAGRPLARVITERDSGRRVSERLNKKLKPSYMSEQISFVGVAEQKRNIRQQTPCVDEKVSEGGDLSESEDLDSEVEEVMKREREERREKRKQEWEEAYSGNIQGPRKKGNQATSSLVTDLEEEITGEDLRIAMLKLVDELKKHADCWPFVDPVTEAIAPGYNDVIKRPMDVLSVERKLKNEEYSSKEQFAKDFRRIFKNCRRYNGADSEYTEMADTIRQHFNKLFFKFFSQPGDGRRLRTPIPTVGSSSDSEGELNLSQGSHTTPGVKRRRKRRTRETPEYVHRPGAAKRSRQENQDPEFSSYPPFYPPYPPYPPYPQDKESGSMYPPFPHEFPPFSYFPPFMSTPHPPYPSFSPYWSQRPSHRHQHKRRSREAPSTPCTTAPSATSATSPNTATTGSTKERREEEAKLQNVIHSQGLLNRHKRDRVTSTTTEHRTAEHSSLSSPDSVTPLAEAPADTARVHREEEESKGSTESRTSSSSSTGGGYPSLGPRPHSLPYGHLPHSYHSPFYPPYMDYMMDPYLHTSPFYDRNGHLPPPPASRPLTHRSENTDKQREVAGRQREEEEEAIVLPGEADLSEGLEAIKEAEDDLKTSKEHEENTQDSGLSSINARNPSPDQFPALAESDTPTPAPSVKITSRNEVAEEQPHSTTEEADAAARTSPSHSHLTTNKEFSSDSPPPLPSNSLQRTPSKRVKSSSRPSLHAPYPYPQRSPYPPMPYPYYPPSPYAHHGFSHPSYDPYYAADMMAWQQLAMAQGIHTSKRRTSRPPHPPNPDPKYYKTPSDSAHRLPPYPGAPSSPEDFTPPYFYPPPPPHPILSKQRKHKSYYETDVLPPPTAYCLPDASTLAEDPSSVPNYKESLADYALHLAASVGGTAIPSSEERTTDDLKSDLAPENDTSATSLPQEHLNEDPLPLSLPAPLLNELQNSLPEPETELVHSMNYNSNNNNNNNNNNNIDVPNLESHIFSFSHNSLSPLRSPPPSYSHFMRGHAPHSLTARPNTLGSFFLPSSTNTPLIPRVSAPPPHKADLKLDWLKQKQSRFNEWLARVNSQSRSRYAQQISNRNLAATELDGTRHKRTQVVPEHSHTNSVPPSSPLFSDKSET